MPNTLGLQEHAQSSRVAGSAGLWSRWLTAHQRRFANVSARSRGPERTLVGTKGQCLAHGCPWRSRLASGEANVRLKAVVTRKNVLLCLLATILAIVGYYTIVVVDARARTSGIADSYYSSGRVKIQAKDLEQAARDPPEGRGPLLLHASRGGLHDPRSGLDDHHPGAGQEVLLR